MIELQKELTGRILDVGGGGEGVIGRLYLSQVTAIDKSQEELDEAPDGFAKVQMDATALQYGDACFDHVTFFYSLLFMDAAEQRQALEEAARVVRRGGQVHIWDCDVPPACELFLTNLDIRLPGERIRTTYGIVKRDGQDADSLSDLCARAGLTLTARHCAQQHFYLKFEK